MSCKSSYFWPHERFQVVVPKAQSRYSLAFGILKNIIFDVKKMIVLIEIEIFLPQLVMRGEHCKGEIP